ncbi:tRNA pseudouridine38-40 synthase [Pilibacter termitis]|uniref:tRNA pseudouridine synthase A n=1 Tax=Pilibacter termitis TaxID=263852 RepID=A0A1T4L1K4_9ENTE|nr:tRNA pseudouridine(38-40) synthase TruA [Pilibacter termitis]SJZ48523.1 tRNA pseudouridine38-40 synthase [Pilibacter termitis]
MTRYKAIIAYDGTNFFGFQRQNEGRTVQQELEKTLTRLNSGVEVTVHGSGRTDSGVHALGQVIHFDLNGKRSEEKLRFALDTQSPNDISVKSVEEVSENWHARYEKHEKTYIFRLDIGKTRSPFKRYYASFFPYPLDFEKMNQAIQKLKGTHDFSGFTATGTSVEDKVRTIYEAKMEHFPDEEELLFTFRGNGFLYKQIRNMVGTLIKIGNGKFEVERMDEILQSGDRNLAGATAHPEGLYLKEVRYVR